MKAGAGAAPLDIDAGLGAGFLFSRQPAEVAVWIGTAAELVEPGTAEGAVRGVPPDEVGDSRRRREQDAHGQKGEYESASHGQPKYSTASPE